jgi:hypothetical protein
MVKELHESRVTDRREFLRRVSGTLAASGVMLSAAAAAEDSGPPAAAEPLPTIALGKYRVTRMVTGWNTIGGHSHQSLNASRHMLQYFTVDRTFEFIRKCEQAGINTWQLDHDEEGKAVQVVRKLREAGSKMQFICLHSEVEDLKTAAKDLDLIGFSHHGSVTDARFREGKSQVVHDYVKKVHDMGLLCGVSAHCPDHTKKMGDEAWENDFFMTCFYHLTYPPKQQETEMGKKVVGEPFFDTDPIKMTEVIRSVDKPCLGFKILAAGRVCRNEKTAKESVEKAFKFAFANIKPIDAVIVGMFPAFYDELSDNVAYVRKYGVVKQPA